jgi:hypothetical protein
MTGATAATNVDLRRAPLADVRGLDLRAADRDFWADEAAIWDRMQVTWAGLDEAAWHLPGAAPSDAGGPDWSLAEHIGHLADWQELASDYVAAALATGHWPTVDDFGGDFDAFNEGRRSPWSTMPSSAIVERLSASRPRLIEVASPLSAAAIRTDDPWGWLYMAVHGHYLDHLTIAEPWADALRARQVDGDPFVDDPRATDLADFVAQEAAIADVFDALVRAVPHDSWLGAQVTPGWDLRDHVGHLADWASEGLRAIEVFHRRGQWLADPEEGIDPWNERHVEAARGETPAETLARYEETRAALLATVPTMSIEELRSPDGWSWVYDCLHGHVRKHLAMVGPWCAAASWPHT